MKRCRIKRVSSWMAEMSISAVYGDIAKGTKWIEAGYDAARLTKLVISELGREWMEDGTEFAIQKLVYAHTEPCDIVIFTDGSVLLGKKECMGLGCL